MEFSGTTGVIAAGGVISPTLIAQVFE